MTTYEFYYLLLVLGAFGAFALALAVASIKYKALLRREVLLLPAKDGRR